MNQKILDELYFDYVNTDRFARDAQDFGESLLVERTVAAARQALEQANPAVQNQETDADALTDMICSWFRVGFCCGLREVSRHLSWKEAVQ